MIFYNFVSINDIKKKCKIFQLQILIFCWCGGCGYVFKLQETKIVEICDNQFSLHSFLFLGLYVYLPSNNIRT